MKEADLHLHTEASDGTDTLEERIRDAERKGLDAIAITDHDRVNRKLGGRCFTAENGVEVVTGAEIKSSIRGRKIEILAYFIDPEGEEIQELFQELSRRRDKRMKEFIDNLNQKYGFAIKFEEVKQKARGNVGRPHLAKTLKEKGIVSSIQEAFDSYIGEEASVYVQVRQIESSKVIEAVHRNGGVTSLAHPGRDLEKSEAKDLLIELKREGLDGLEIKYSYGDKRGKNSYSVNFGEEFAAGLSDDLNLLKTGGSDCHGSDSDKYLLGEVRIPYSRLEALKSRIDF